MSRQQPDLMIDGVRLPLAAAGVVSQSYEDFGGFGVLRLGLGAAVHQQAWRRVRTTLSASGWVPAGLDALDWIKRGVDNGAGGIQDFVTLFTALPKVDAGLAASIFHFGEVQIPDLKQALHEAGIPMRRV